MSIDFSAIDRGESNCVKQYKDDGTYSVFKCFVDYGTGIFIDSLDQETQYLHGIFSFKDGVFTITTFDGVSYSFTEVGSNK